ncbi:MAG: hypothetical protein ACYTBZ_29955 [Planctomycetota bacterium]|jgi:hypothetical protein
MMAKKDVFAGVRSATSLPQLRAELSKLNPAKLSAGRRKKLEQLVDEMVEAVMQATVAGG